MPDTAIVAQCRKIFNNSLDLHVVPIFSATWRRWLAFIDQGVWDLQSNWDTKCRIFIIVYKVWNEWEYKWVKIFSMNHKSEIERGKGPQHQGLLSIHLTPLVGVFFRNDKFLSYWNISTLVIFLDICGIIRAALIVKFL